MWAMCEPSGPIENGTTYIVRPRIEPLNSSSSTSRISAGSRQLLVGPASSSRSRADEGPVLDPGDVAGVGAGQVRVRPLRVGELLEGAAVDQLLAEAVVLLRGAVAPVDRVRLGQLGELARPRRSASCSWSVLRRRPSSRSRVGSTPLRRFWNGKRPEAIPDVGHCFAPRRMAASAAFGRVAALDGRQARVPARSCASTSTSHGGSSSGPGSRSRVRLLHDRRRGARGGRGDRRAGGDQVPGADRRPDEGGRRQVRRHARARPREHAAAILELEINGHMPRGVLVDPKAEVAQEYYAGVRLGRDPRSGR